MIEKWKDIPGYEGMYQVSDQGRVKSLDRCVKGRRGKITGRVLKGSTQSSGYTFVSLAMRGKYKYSRNHRLVAEVFIPNPENKPCVNHIDGNKMNNTVQNLEWCTYSENIKHAFRNNLKTAKGIKNSQSKLSVRQVLDIRELSNVLNNVELAKIFGVTRSNINAVVRRRSWKHI